ncbi:NAD-binding protein [Nocardia cyriacigeorgica]|uniref:NAD-binding protein n=2 Tax=Nocardia cyriacigeorgica TaxID=135487 RepID=UPI0018949ABB|nr:NAD-binding protein [Nocardia cyriacigeorgica]MBF6454197.1 FAD-dependent monooxygenase [Nocardia cyriacigeorgica]MBF6552091.1 FAD-dependent monooxygenase [Nocardia cyriacigeorgica]
MQVLITGAGPIGLPVALGLVRRGIAVRVVDRAGRLFADAAADSSLASALRLRGLDRQARRGAGDALLERLADLGLAVELGTALVSLRSEPVGVTAVLARAGGIEVRRFGYVIAADDSRELVRRTGTCGTADRESMSIRAFVARDLGIGDAEGDALPGAPAELVTASARRR